MKEEELIQKAQMGESWAFGALYDAYLPKIYRFIFVKVSRKSDAEDLTHQVFLNAWEHIRSYKFQGFPFSSWLYRIAHNAVIDFYRTNKNPMSLELVSENSLGEVPDAFNEIDQKLNFAITKVALSRLKPDEQSVLLMKFVDDLSNKEIAKALGKSEGAVRVTQHRALKQLKLYLNDAIRPDNTTKTA